MKYSSNKDMNDAAKELRQNGWVLTRTRKHYVWKSPCGSQMLVFSYSPGDRRAVKNKRAEMRKALRNSQEGNHGTQV